jgi:hypothetical protein
VQDITESLATEKKSGKTESLQKLRVELDKAKAFLAEHKAALSKLEERRKRRDRKKPAEDRPSKSSSKVKAKKSKERNERHALTIALMREGKSEAESLAIAYDIIEKGQFSWDKLPSDIKGSYKD